MTKTILVVAAHPDDEVLGCGGTIARHVADGDNVHVLFMADGVGARDHKNTKLYERRNLARVAALKILGVSEFYALDFPDNRMDSIPLLDIVQALEPIVRNIQPVRVYTHHHGDLNVDHRLTHKAVLTACRPLPAASVREILAFEVMSNTEWANPGCAPFVPNVFVDITNHLDTKLNALAAYDLEIRPPPHSRSFVHLESLARHRGHSVGVEAAEAFEVVRLVS